MIKTPYTEREETMYKTYVGKPVEAVQLTKENAEEVAVWVDGRTSVKIFNEVDESGDTVSVEKVRVYIEPHKAGAWKFGSLGDWFVKDSQGIVRIFPKNIFPKIFDEK